MSLTDRTEVTDPQLPSLKSLPEDAPPQTFVVEKEGEMPSIVAPKAVNSTSGGAIGRSIAAHLSEQDSRPVSRSSSLLAQELAREEGDRPGTPDAIKVVRSKKKGATRKQKTATVHESTAP